MQVLKNLNNGFRPGYIYDKSDNCIFNFELILTTILCCIFCTEICFAYAYITYVFTKVPTYLLQLLIHYVFKKYLGKIKAHSQTTLTSKGEGGDNQMLRYLVQYINLRCKLVKEEGIKFFKILSTQFMNGPLVQFWYLQPHTYSQYISMHFSTFVCLKVK